MTEIISVVVQFQRPRQANKSLREQFRNRKKLLCSFAVMNEGSEETAEASMCKYGLLAPEMSSEKRCDYRRSSCMKCL